MVPRMNNIQLGGEMIASGDVGLPNPTEFTFQPPWLCPMDARSSLFTSSTSDSAFFTCRLWASAKYVGICVQV